ncbi:MAG: universal stress protein UspA [Anaerovoracaceae bacterium]|jgi:K+-sensing histidine kinase KdpD
MGNVMVCVTQQKSCDRLIKYGKKVLDEVEGELFIIHIAHYDYKFLGHSQESEALEYLYQKALEYGANLTVVRSNNILSTLAELVDKNRIAHVVMGESRETKSSANMPDQFKKMINGKAELSVLPSLPE